MIIKSVIFNLVLYKISNNLIFKYILIFIQKVGYLSVGNAAIDRSYPVYIDFNSFFSCSSSSSPTASCSLLSRFTFVNWLIIRSKRTMEMFRDVSIYKRCLPTSFASSYSTDLPCLVWTSGTK